jgi:hypothetical protein
MNLGKEMMNFACEVSFFILLNNFYIPQNLKDWIRRLYFLCKGRRAADLIASLKIPHPSPGFSLRTLDPMAIKLKITPSKWLHFILNSFLTTKRD